MKLYTSPTSPFARKILILIAESGLAGQVEIIETRGAPVGEPPALAKDNPLGKIPTLILGDGTALYDSRVITRYLDDLSGAGLYPTDARQWPVLTLEALADGMNDAAVLMSYERMMRPEAHRWSDWIEGQWAKVDRALTMLEARGTAQLEGPLDIGQIALGAALGYLDLRHGARNWREGRPQIAAWFATFDARPSMRQSAPPV